MQSIFGGTIEIMKEIIGRGPACRPDQALYVTRATRFSCNVRQEVRVGSLREIRVDQWRTLAVTLRDRTVNPHRGQPSLHCAMT